MLLASFSSSFLPSIADQSVNDDDDHHPVRLLSCPALLSNNSNRVRMAVGVAAAVVVTEAIYECVDEEIPKGWPIRRQHTPNKRPRGKMSSIKPKMLFKACHYIPPRQ